MKLLNPIEPNLETTEAESILEGAVVALQNGDDGAHWKPEAIEAARWILSCDRPLFQRFRAQLKRASHNSQVTEWTREVNRQWEGAEESTKGQELIDLVLQTSKVFHDPAGNCFVEFEQRGHREVWPLKSDGFANWLRYKAYREFDYSPTDSVMSAALAVLHGVAIHDGEEREVYLRCAPWKDGYIIDLTNDSWQVVIVLPTGYEVLDESPVAFIRSNTSAPLPLPIDGNFNLLWRYANVAEDERSLVLAFVLDSWRPDTPYPILYLTGEQGSGKSSTHRSVRQICDPNAIPLRTAPKSVEDLFVSAGVNHQASFENMSSLSGPLQDALCTLATGAGFAKRKLYSDSDETVIEVKRPVIINGISDVVTRPDLIDRMVHINTRLLATIAEEVSFNEGFDQDRSAIFGGLLGLFVKVLSELPTITLDEETRLIDFAKMGEAIHKVQCLPKGSFMDSYLRNKNASLARSIEASPIAMALQDFIKGRSDAWSGTIKSLQNELDASRRQEGEGWPKTPRGLGDVLRRMAPALLSVGIRVDFLGHKRDGSHIRLGFAKKLKCSCDDHNDHNDHNDHIRGAASSHVDCDGVTVVTDDIEKKNQAAGKSARGLQHSLNTEVDDSRSLM